MATSQVSFTHLADVIQNDMGYQLCVECFQEQKLHQLPCNHLLCSDCIDKLSLDDGLYCPKPECKRLCSGTASLHPKAIAAMATNQTLGDQKDDDEEGYADSKEAMLALESGFKDLIRQHARRAMKITDKAQREITLQQTNRFQEQVSAILEKIWTAIKAAAKWVWNGIKAVGSWIKGLWGKFCEAAKQVGSVAKDIASQFTSLTLK